MKPISFTEINCRSAEYGFVEELLHSAFPVDERRDDDAQRANTLYEPRFHTMLIRLDGEPAGLLTYWDFDEYRYGEHFAIAESMRCGGIGAQVLRAFIESAPTPMVLEVEPEGSTPMAERRIAFYKRNGLQLWDTPYMQPPYRAGGDWLSLCLMATPDLDRAKAPEVISAIHHNVYGTSE